MNQNSVYDTNYDYSGYQSGDLILQKRQDEYHHNLNWLKCLLVGKVYKKMLTLTPGRNQLLTDPSLLE